MKKPRRLTLLERKLKELRDGAKRFKARGPLLTVLDAAERAIPGVVADAVDWGSGYLTLPVDRFGDAAPALRTLRKVFGRRPDVLPEARPDHEMRRWEWHLPVGKIYFDARLTGNVCRLIQVGSETIEHPARTEVRPIYRVECPPEEAKA